MAKRLSSLFLAKGVDSPSNILQKPSTPTQPSDNQQDLARLDMMKTAPHILHKNYILSPSLVEDNHSYYPPSPLTPPPMLGDFGRARSNVRDDSSSQPGSRDGSRSRPQTPTFPSPSPQADSPAAQSRLKRRSHLADGKGEPRAWIAGVGEYLPYEPEALFRGQKVTELWNENGDTEISIFPRSYRCPPSFRVNSSLFADSAVFQDLLHDASQQSNTQELNGLEAPFNRMSIQSFSGTAQSPFSPHKHPNFSMPTGYSQPQNIKRIQLELEFQSVQPPLDGELHPNDEELLILYRNFFCFLFGGALVSTPRQRHLFPIFLGISSVLKKYRFSSSDGSTWGSTPTASFDGYVQELNLADVRGSREKAVEALVLGERMRSWPLYVEGFTHVVARFEDVKALGVPSFANISGITLNRLERSHLDLEQRLLVVRSKLQDFDFPFMFSGIANSATSFEAKQVRFKAWKASFLDFRKRTVAFYSRKYGQWPPNARSKKNRFEVSGLNRQVLQELYRDFCDLYEVLVDRSMVTPRMTEPTVAADRADTDVNESIFHAIRRVENEYDMSTPPVMPPIPYDTPLLPGLQRKLIPENLNKNVANTSRRLKESEVNETLFRACNRDLIKGTPWIQNFLTYERQMASGRTMEEIVDLRCGQWLFVYAVIQSLPMTVVDCKDLKFTEDVEYFLCMPPRGGRPWMRDEVNSSRTWYNVSGGTGILAQPADLIDHSAEGVYRRSYCWEMAEIWAGRDFPSSPSLHSAMNVPMSSQTRRLTPPSVSPHPSPMLRPMSEQDLTDYFGPGGSRRSSNVGLGEQFSSQNDDSSRTSPRRPVSLHINNPNVTFDSILGSTDSKPSKKNKKK